MKRIKILRLLSGLIVFSTTFLNFSSPVVALDNLTSPKIDARVASGLLSKDDDYQNINFEAKVKSNNEIAITIKNYSAIDEQSDFDVSADDELFVVIKDKFGLNPPQKTFLNRVDVDSKVVFSNTIKLPYHYDMIYLEVYKQKRNEQEFVEKEENFVGKTNLFTTANLFWDRDEEGYELMDKELGESGLFFRGRLTPNIYSIRFSPSEYTYFKTIAKIILPQGQENLMSEEDKTCITYSQQFDGNNGIGRYHMAFSFYIPSTVNKFKVVLYRNTISDDSIVFESDFINLNLK